MGGPIGVSIIRLIGAPHEYSGKLVRVIGYLHIAFEADAIYVHQDDYKHSITKNGLWVHASKEMKDQLTKLSGQYVLIEGAFDSAQTSMWSGGIVWIYRAQAWPTSLPKR